MNGDISVGGRPLKNDRRSTDVWVGRMTLKATEDHDPFILAAIGRALFGGEKSAKALKRSIIAEAKRCQRDYEGAL